MQDYIISERCITTHRKRMGHPCYNYDTGNNQLISVDSFLQTKSVYTYDENGNLITDSDKNAEFEYDIYNQLKTVVFPSSIGNDSLIFGYNTDGQRISKRYIHYYLSEDCGGGGQQSAMMMGGGLLDMGTESLGGASTMGLGGGGIIFPPPEEPIVCTLRTETSMQYVRSKLNNQVLAEYDLAVGANTTTNYIYAGDKRIAMVDIEGNVFYYLNDHLGSTRVMVKEDGTIQDRYNRYLAFGGDDGSSTTVAFQIYGDIKYRKAFPDGIEDGKSCHEMRAALVKKGEKYLEWSGKQYLGEIPEDVYIDGELVAKAGSLTEIGVAHSGIELGQTPYGQTMVLSKLGPNRPVTIQTGRSLNQYFKQFNPITGENYGNAWFYQKTY